MFHFQSCQNVPVLLGGRGGGSGGGLVEVEGSVMWGGGRSVCSLDAGKDEWKKWPDDINLPWATLGMCGGTLVAVGGRKSGVVSKEVMLWRGGKWSPMPEMLVGCMKSCVVSVGGGGLVVMGGLGDRDSLAVVQVFDGKTQTWHLGPSLPEPCDRMSAVVHGDQVFIMGGTSMDKAVWCADINDVVSHCALCSISVSLFSVCVCV